MRKSGRLAAEVLDMIAAHVQPGVTTGELNTLCHDMIVGAGAIPAPLGYRGFPKSICTSVNHVVCHGIPGDLRLKDGDIVQCRCHRDLRRLARRHVAHVFCGRAESQSQAPDAGDL